MQDALQRTNVWHDSAKVGGEASGKTSKDNLASFVYRQQKSIQTENKYHASCTVELTAGLEDPSNSLSAIGSSRSLGVAFNT
jgi:hypothetical protein